MVKAENSGSTVKGKKVAATSKWLKKIEINADKLHALKTLYEFIKQVGEVMEELLIGGKSTMN